MTRACIAALLALSLAAAGCGKKGPLYHPDGKKDEKPEASQTPPPPDPTSEPENGY